jgi:hypothetical protein
VRNFDLDLVSSSSGDDSATGQLLFHPSSCSASQSMDRDAREGHVASFDTFICVKKKFGSGWDTGILISDEADIQQGGVYVK